MKREGRERSQDGGQVREQSGGGYARDIHSVPDVSVSRGIIIINKRGCEIIRISHLILISLKNVSCLVRP